MLLLFRIPLLLQILLYLKEFKENLQAFVTPDSLMEQVNLNVKTYSIKFLITPREEEAF
jgi:hypothetical protein